MPLALPPGIDLRSTHQAVNALTSMGASNAHTASTPKSSTACSTAWSSTRRVFDDKLQEWDDYYNYQRPHGALDGQTQTPYERLKQKTQTGCNQAAADAHREGV